MERPLNTASDPVSTTVVICETEAVAEADAGLFTMGWV